MSSNAYGKPTNQFRHWYPFHGLETALQNCAAELQNYWDNVQVDGAEPNSCAAVQSCMLDNIPEHAKANMAAAAILLGLMPAVFTTLGFSSFEIAPLALRRPVFATLLIISSPDVHMVPVFDPPPAMDYHGASSPTSEWLRRNVARLEKHRRAVQYCFDALEYILLAAVAANIMHTLIDLELHSVLVWRCNTPFLSLTWILSGFFVHLVAYVGLLELSWPAASSIQVFRRAFTTLVELVRLEFAPSLFLQEAAKERRLWDTIFADLMYRFASVLAVANCVFGIILLSSYLFISTPDALRVMIRYANSAMVSRVLFVLERDVSIIPDIKEGVLGARRSDTVFYLL